MDKNTEDILRRYKQGTATAREKLLVESWLLHGADEGFDLTDKELLEDLISIRQQIDFNPPKRQRTLLWQRIAVAASVMMVATLAVMLYKGDVKPRVPVAAMESERPAGTNSATLTLSDGSRISLDGLVGDITKEAGIKITNDAHGNVVYKVSAQNTAHHRPAAFNTISTPRGGQYKIILPDGSQVWLNAASSLRFPVTFSDTDRNVELTGEGYFEVAKAAKKFRVVTGATAVEVLGTHFNVNAYDNESACNITLLEGSVRVKNGMAGIVMKPGEQASVKPLVNNIQVNAGVDTEAVTAWKDGTFKFAGTDLKDIMRQLERWYDVEVDEDSMPDKKFNGTISRDVRLSEVLAMIELTSNLHFKIEGRRIIMK